jgi:acetyltransferase-like isoleucine patch superfamily enzyme
MAVPPSTIFICSGDQVTDAAERAPGDVKVSSVRRLVARIYVAVWLFRLRALAGRLCLVFFRLVYPGLWVGARPHVWGSFELMMFPDSTVMIGDDLHMVSSSARSAITLFSRCSLTTFAGAEIRIGKGVGLNGTTITSKKRIQIGDGTMIAPNVIIVDSDFHAQWPPESRFVSSTADADREVVIGKNVWIGMNTVVLKGSTIGDNSIIGAGSVVSGSIPANAIAAGNPARVVRELAPPTERV